MGIPVIILGHSGTGKSTSLRNFKSDEILHINVMGKPLPFRGRFAETYNGDDYVKIVKAINATKKKVVVVDDAQYLMGNAFMRRASEKGYDKFTEIGADFWALVNGCREDLPYDVIVYFLMHIGVGDDGVEKPKTVGRMLDEKVVLEGMVTVCLKTAVVDGKYSFLTQSNGKDVVKSPLGMFPTYEIDNDLKAVDTIIRKYWELDIPFEDSREIMAAHDAEVDAGGVSTEAPKAESARRMRRKRAESVTEPAAEEKAPPHERRRRKRTESAESDFAEISKDDFSDVPEEDLLKGADPRERSILEDSVEILSLEEQTTEEKPRSRRRRTRTE